VVEEGALAPVSKPPVLNAEELTWDFADGRRLACAEVLDLNARRVHTRGDVRPEGRMPFVVRAYLR
jgi:hypothetical protein